MILVELLYLLQIGLSPYRARNDESKIRERLNCLNGSIETILIAGNLSGKADVFRVGVSELYFAPRTIFVNDWVIRNHHRLRVGLGETRTDMRGDGNDRINSRNYAFLIIRISPCEKAHHALGKRQSIAVRKPGGKVLVTIKYDFLPRPFQLFCIRKQFHIVKMIDVRIQFLGEFVHMTRSQDKPIECAGFPLSRANKGHAMLYAVFSLSNLKHLISGISKREALLQ